MTLEGDAIEIGPGGRFSLYTVTWPDWRAKSAWLQAGAERDAAHPVVREAARQFAAVADPLQRARAVHRFVRDGVRYTRDPKKHGQPRERFACTPYVLSHPYEDCDGKARAFVALCLACHLPARVKPVVVGGNLVHFQAEVAPLADRPGDWILSELTLDGVELGQGPGAGRVGPDGRLVTR